MKKNTKLAQSDYRIVTMIDYAEGYVVPNYSIKTECRMYHTDVDPVGTQTVITPEDIELERKVNEYLATASKVFTDAMYAKFYKG